MNGWRRVTQKVRDRYKAQLSITAFGDADTIIIANSFSERRGMNMTVLREHLTARFEWLATVQGHENVITLDIEELPSHLWPVAAPVAGARVRLPHGLGGVEVTVM